MFYGDVWANEKYNIAKEVRCCYNDKINKRGVLMARRREKLPAALEFVILTFAALLAAGGIYFFRFPNNFTFGGVAGLAVVLSNLLPFSAAFFNTVINAVLLVIGFLFLGKGFGVKTVYLHCCLLRQFIYLSFSCR